MLIIISLQSFHLKILTLLSMESPLSSDLSSIFPSNLQTLQLARLPGLVLRMQKQSILIILGGQIELSHGKISSS